MKKKSIVSSRGKVYYWIEKNDSDKCIVFTHGVTADHTLFDKQIDFWSKEYTVITWDMPLHGNSRPYEDFSISNAAKELKHILDNEKITHAVMAGQSAGGYVAQEFTNKYSDMVDAFIGIDSSPLGERYYRKIEIFMASHFSFFAKFYPYKYYCKEASKASTNTIESYRSFYNCLDRLGKKGMLECGDAMYKDFLSYTEVDFKCPVLLILGELDKVGMVKQYTENWHNTKGYPLVILRDASHNSNYDNYDDFNRIVYDFLKKEV